jgi:hypothetical protein
MAPYLVTFSDFQLLWTGSDLFAGPQLGQPVFVHDFEWMKAPAAANTNSSFEERPANGIHVVLYRCNLRRRPHRSSKNPLLHRPGRGGYI